MAALAPSARAQNPAVSITVDTNTNRRAINPLIYGLNYADPATLTDLNCPLNRMGGNNTSRYNWTLNADNRGSDWYFESLAYSSATPGEVGDTFIGNSRSAGASPMITIPTIGWVANLGYGRQRLSSFSIARYGAQTGSDWQWFPDAGNGVASNGVDIAGNDPNDANVPVDSSFQAGWVQHLVSKWGTAASGGVRYYIMDNEPGIWYDTHRDVHPVGPIMDEVRDRILDYAAKVKSVDPSAQVVGPEEWGWGGYILSGYDAQYGSLHGWGINPDRTAHGGWDFLPWLLDQLRQNAAATGQRLLDVFSVHYYPQGGEYWGDTSTSMQLLRNRSTRSLWDPSYVDESWIATNVMLVPRLRQWVATYYPGTKTAVTEYNWGAEAHINGATAQADILGIFGREGLDMATRWTTPASSTPTYKAMKMYRNYDGARSSFGDLSVGASGPNPDVLSSFAALRSSDNALTIMVISKALSGSTPMTVNLSGFAAGSSAQVWQLDAGNTIRRLADVAVSGSSFSQGVPAQSITLYVVPAGTGKIRKPRRRPGDTLSAGTPVSAPASVRRPPSAPARSR
jgi:glycosyl hydrolase family 44